MMSTAQEIQQQDFTWLDEAPDRHSFVQNWGFGREYLLRREAGQHPEVWDTNGGTDGGSFWGLRILWVPEESVFLACSCGLAPAWYYSPLNRDMLLHELAAWGSEDCGWSKWCTELKYYRWRIAACYTCGTILTADDWTTALYVADGKPDEPLCHTCLHAEYDAPLAPLGS
jgi:hypothetical protein